MVSGLYASFISGVLQLTDEQYRSRAHALKPLGNGLYQVTGPIGFKHGELVGFDGEVNKALMQALEEEELPETDKPRRERHIEEIKKAVVTLTDEELLAMLDAEAGGKNRKGVIKIIEEEMAGRTQLGGDGNE